MLSFPGFHPHVTGLEQLHEPLRILNDFSTIPRRHSIIMGRHNAFSNRQQPRQHQLESQQQQLFSTILGSIDDFSSTTQDYYRVQHIEEHVINVVILHRRRPNASSTRPRLQQPRRAAAASPF